LIASLFKSNVNSRLPGIPFDRARFQEEEKTRRVDFDSVELVFRSQTGESSNWSHRFSCSERIPELDKFKGIYSRLKDAWLKEQDELGI
jgi:hypothetical protein